MSSIARQLSRMATGTALGCAIALGTAGCGQATGAFQESGGRPDCQIHQAAAPNTDYTGGSDADTWAILAMMRYFTAHRAQAYCDGRPASSADRAWSTLYQRFAAAPGRPA